MKGPIISQTAEILLPKLVKMAQDGKARMLVTLDHDEGCLTAAISQQ